MLIKITLYLLTIFILNPVLSQSLGFKTIQSGAVLPKDSTVLSSEINDSVISNSANMDKFSISNVENANIVEKNILIIKSFPLKRFRVSSPFGVRIHPVTGSFKLHKGVDLKANYEDVLNVMNGLVEKVGYDDVSGNYVVMFHGNNLETVYAHLSTVCVKVGSYISGGEKIAVSGATGRVTGPHLHFSVKLKGEYIDPSLVLGYLWQLH